MHVHNIDDLTSLDSLRESFELELKTWISPDNYEGIAKIAKASLALRNQNGGTLAIGVNNDTGQPDPYVFSERVEDLFSTDKVQQIVAKYASEPFPIDLAIVPWRHNTVVFIRVPRGFKYPVASRSALFSAGKEIIKSNQIYVRTLSSNNSVSTSEITHKDISSLFDRCFENREADISRFIKRNFAASEMKAILSSILGGQKDEEVLEPPKIFGSSESCVLFTTT